MPLAGTGKGTADGGANSSGTPPYYIERPLVVYDTRINTYRKSHKFMTFGLAPAIIAGPSADPSNRFLTTYLAEIPWHIPALYLNQSEFNLLPDGSHVVEVDVQVFYRGTVIQFETAASTTGLATLNQINDIAVGYALNKTGWGQSVSLVSFQNNSSMTPQAIAKPKYDAVGTSYRGMVADYYGTNNNDANFGNYYPKHQIGRHAFLYNYFALSNRVANATGNQANTDIFGGWPTITDKLEQMDGKTVVNTCVAKMNYKPKMGFIKRPLGTVGHGLPWITHGTNSNFMMTNGHFPASYQMILSRAPLPTGTAAGTNQGPFQVNNDNSQATTMQNVQFGGSSAEVGRYDFTIYNPIEKSQIARTGFWGENDGHVQPSLHVGVQPVPALQTAQTIINAGAFTNWTDTRAYWEVVATMKVANKLTNAYPYATVPNVPVGDNILWCNNGAIPPVLKNPRDDSATFAGLYPTPIVNVGDDIPNPPPV